MRWMMGCLFAMLLGANAHATGKLVVEHAWIRTPPPGAMMLAGYATLRNAGDASLVVIGANSAAFGDVSLHESVIKNGVERMQPLGDITIAPGAEVVFAPGGKHFMLMRPARELKSDDVVKVHISTKTEAGATANFVVRDTAP